MLKIASGKKNLMELFEEQIMGTMISTTSDFHPPSSPVLTSLDVFLKKYFKQVYSIPLANIPRLSAAH